MSPWLSPDQPRNATRARRAARRAWLLAAQQWARELRIAVTAEIRAIILITGALSVVLYVIALVVDGLYLAIGAR